MVKVALKVNKRTSNKGLKSIRKESAVPAVIYGLGKDPVALKMAYSDFERAFRVASYSTLIDLDVDNSKEKVLVKDVQYHPVTDNVLHVDFLRVDMKKEITAEVGLVFTGAAPAVKNEGCVLTTARDFVEIKCLPDDLVHDIEVSLNSLEHAGDALHVKDLKLPKGVAVTDDPEIVLVQVMITRVEEEVAAPIATPDQVQVTTEKKAEEGVEGDGDKKEGNAAKGEKEGGRGEKREGGREERKEKKVEKSK